MVKLFLDAGIIAMTAFISPYRKDRERIRDLAGPDRLFEVYVKCPVEVCAQPDQKGIYAKAKAGIIKEFTGISAPYEAPESPCAVIRSDKTTVLDAAKEIVGILRTAKIIA